MMRETASMEHSGKKAGREELGAGSEGGSVRQTLRKPVQVPTAGQSSWLSEFIEETGMHRTDQLGYQSSLPK